MTQIIEDNVNVRLQLGTEGQGVVNQANNSFDENALFWDVVEMKVELSQVASPNYAKGKVIPKQEFGGDVQDIISEGSDDGNELTPNSGISRLVGSHFRLEADNDLVAVDVDTQSEERNNRARQTVNDVPEGTTEDSLLFNGRLANISPVGTNLYEIIAYDPGQQSFNIGAESGSIINQKLDLRGVEDGGGISVLEPEQEQDNNVEGELTIPATEVVEAIVDQAGIQDRRVILEEDFTVGGSTSAGFGPLGGLQVASPGQEIQISFDKLVVPVKEALNRVRERTNTEWWFDKDGTLYFGDPANPTIGSAGSQVFEVSLITDTSAGITTPPYQSVRVIAPSLGSAGGSRTTQQFISDDGEKLVIEANIAQPDAGGEQAENIIELDPDSVQEPTFQYINAELNTDEQVQNTALKIADEFIKQQADGNVTVVGMAEVQPFDGIVMPNSKNQPMGGQLYDVYSVVHKLNTSDGFVTEIEVAGPNPRIRDVADVGAEGDRNLIATSVDRDVVTPDGERRAFSSGAGEGSDTDFESEDARRGI